MRLEETLRQATDALARNRLRSALTALGVIIGVFSVIAIVAVGRGAQQMVSDSLKSFGAGALFVLPGQQVMGGVRTATENVNSLVPEDAEAIARECSAVEEVCPFAVASGTVVAGNRNWPTVVQGTGHNVLRTRDWTLAAGALFTESDVRRTAKVCVLGQTVSRRLFGGASPIGATVRIKRVPFRVVGLLTARGQSGMGQDQDDLVLAPYTVVMKRLSGLTYLHAVQCTARTPALVEELKREVSAVLARRHRLRPDATPDFTLIAAGDIMRLVDRIYGTLVAFLGAVASIALVVGGIGIMNIMLVSVSERVHEIGLRLAVGARTGDILRQFLAEALILSCAGGAIGVALGIALAQAVTLILRWPVLVDFASTALAFSLSALVGVVFGLFPAWKASRLAPIEALRAQV